MWHKKSTYSIFLFLVIMLPNIIALLSRFWFEIDRPLFIYEYLFVFLLMSFRIHYFYSWAFFVLVFFVDLTTIFSKIYLFSLSDFLKSLEYLFNYSININQLTLILSLTFGLIGLFYLFRFIKIKIENDKPLIYIFLLIFTFTFSLDTINGSSFLMSYNFNTNFYKGNFAGAPTQTIYNLIRVANFSTNEPILNKKSITFKHFAIDTTNSQLLIIAESMGLIDDTIKRKVYQQSISDIFNQKHWKTSWGKIQFTGSTTSAELRELLNCAGSYQYFIKQKFANNISSIFRIKKKQGFHTNAIHSYKGDMFQRNTWWKNIGVEEVYFRENVQALYNYKLKLNYNSSFNSLYDEDAFDFIQSKTSKERKHFSYFLTENGHLPFMSNVEKPIFSHLFDIDNEINLSAEAKNQHKRISNFLVYVASHLDSSKFQSILIVGDHMPPFVKKKDREFYNNHFVPYCIVTK
jgi:hypothetical protein